MSAQHTPGKLQTRKGFHTDTIEIFKPDRSIKKPFYATELATVKAEDKEGKANARRLVACWNACEGLETDQIESMVNVSEFFFKQVELLIQRDELLAALKDIAEESTDPGAFECARAAIAKAGGEA